MSHVICLAMSGWFISLGAFSIVPLITGHTTAVFAPGTDFFPPPDCKYGSGAVITVLRVLVAATSAPAGVLVSVLFNLLFLSQFLAVAFAKQTVDNLNRKLNHDHELKTASSAGESGELMRTLSKSSADETDEVLQAIHQWVS
jgi:hypothetical protein